MGKTVHIFNVPDAVYASLEARASLAGLPLTDFLLAELRRVAELSTGAELAARLRGREQSSLQTSPARALRAERGR